VAGFAWDFSQGPATFAPNFGSVVLPAFPSSSPAAGQLPAGVLLAGGGLLLVLLLLAARKGSG
jgi:hypothetical protein